MTNEDLFVYISNIICPVHVLYI